jgi:hypothetical protein
MMGTFHLVECNLTTQHHPELDDLPFKILPIQIEYCTKFISLSMLFWSVSA